MAETTASSQLGSPFANLKVPKPKKLLDIKNPSNRNKEGYLSVCENFYYFNYTQTNNEYISTLKQQEWVTNRLISQGKREDDWLYNKLFGEWNKGGSGAGGTQNEAERDLMRFINLDWERLKFWPQLRDQIISRAEQMDFDNVCSAINPEAGDMKEDIKWQLWTQVQNKAFNARMEALTGQPIAGQIDTPIPINNRQDLEVWMKTGFKHNFETAMQVAVKSAFNGSDIPKKPLTKMLIEDDIDIGFHAVDTEVNPFDGTTSTIYVDPINAIIPEFRGHLLDRPKKIAYFKTYTAQDLMTMIDQPLTDGQKARLISFNKYQFGNTAVAGNVGVITNTDSENSIWQTFNVPVMKMYFLNSDRLKFTEKNGGLGKKFTPADIGDIEGDTEYIDSGSEPGNPKKAIKSVKGYDLEYYEQVSWVVGTDIVFNYGKVPNQASDVAKGVKPICPMLVYRVNTASLTDRIRSFDEAAQLAWAKMQQAKAAARPKGVNIDISALAAVNVGGKISQRACIQIFNATGNLIWNSSPNITPGERANYKPITDNEGGLGRDFQAWLEDLHFNIDMMQQVIGLSDPTANGAPEARIGVGIGEMAQESTINSLAQIIDGVGTTFDRLSEIIAQRIQWQVRSGDIEVFENSLGKTITHILGMDVAQHRFAFQWCSRPTKQMKQDLLDTIKQVLINPTNPMQGGAHLDDYFYLYDMINSDAVDFKLIQLIAASICKKNIDEQTQQSMASQQVATQGADALQDKKHKQDMETKQFERETDLAKINATGQWNLQISKQKDMNGAHHLLIKGNQEQQKTILEHQLTPQTENK